MSLALRSLFEKVTGKKSTHSGKSPTLNTYKLAKRSDTNAFPFTFCYATLHHLIHDSAEKIRWKKGISENKIIVQRSLMESDLFCPLICLSINLLGQKREKRKRTEERGREREKAEGVSQRYAHKKNRTKEKNVFNSKNNSTHIHTLRGTDRETDSLVMSAHASLSPFN